MSFQNIKYQSNAGGVYRMRISSDKAGLAGDGSIAALVTDPNVEVLVRKNRRRSGISARGVRFSQDIAATGGRVLKVYVFVPCVTPAVQAALLSEDTITYKGQTWSNPLPVAEG